MDLIDNLPESVFQEYIDDLLKSASGAVFAGKSRNIHCMPVLKNFFGIARAFEGSDPC